MEVQVKTHGDHKRAVADAITQLTAKVKQEGILTQYRNKTEFVPKGIRRKRKAIENARHHRKYQKRIRPVR